MEHKAADEEEKRDEWSKTAEQAADKIGILIVDDHPVIRYGLTGLFNAVPDFCVLGEAATCAECCEKVVSLTPDIVILDLEMEDACGVEALKKLHIACPKVPVIIYSSYCDDERVVEAIRSNVQGYLRKDTRTQNLIDAVRLVHRGKTFLDPAITSKVLEQLTHGPARQALILSNREKEVLRLLAQGKRNKDIANRLFVCERTVKFHVSALFDKLGVSNRTEAALVARKYGSVVM